MSKFDKIHHQVEELDKGLKYDEDPYEKPDLSLVPCHMLINDSHPTGAIKQVAHQIHKHLNSGDTTTVNFVQFLFHEALEEIPIDRMAVALGYGAVKYERNNWKKGFGGDPSRFLRACLRHCMSYLNGEKYDGLAIGPYKHGNPHDGAILFSLMAAMHETRS